MGLIMTIILQTQSKNGLRCYKEKSYKNQHRMKSALLINYCILPNYRTYSYKSIFKQFLSLQITAVYFNLFLDKAHCWFSFELPQQERHTNFLHVKENWFFQASYIYIFTGK